MKTTFAAVLATLAFSVPVFAETSAEELFRMSNESAAETILREHSMGDMTAAQVTLALDNMSPAERQVFYDKSPADRMEILGCMKATDSGDSAAESCAIK